RLPDTSECAMTELPARLHRGRCDRTPDSPPGRVGVRELRAEEQVGTSVVSSGAVNGFRHPYVNSWLFRPLLGTLLFEMAFLGIAWWALAAAAMAPFLFLVCKAVEIRRLQRELTSAAVMYRGCRGGEGDGTASRR
ncbi:MAG: hypothetical protein QOD39_1736, partial [Mycobacterium sp.]|nr:hypothetical protein [Mycobacterium sp.]